MKKDSLLTRQLDEYRLISLLGKGGMARVYLGLDVRLRRYVAIKVIDTPHQGTLEYIRRFERDLPGERMTGRNPGADDPRGPQRFGLGKRPGRIVPQPFDRHVGGLAAQAGRIQRRSESGCGMSPQSRALHLTEPHRLHPA